MAEELVLENAGDSSGIKSLEPIVASQAAKILNVLKATGFTGCGKLEFVKGTDFSPYITSIKSSGL